MPKAKPDYMQMTSRNPHAITQLTHLYFIQHLLLELPLNLLTLLVCVRLAVEVKKSAKVELGCLQELDFADMDLADVNKIPPISDISTSTYIL